MGGAAIDDCSGAGDVAAVLVGERAIDEDFIAFEIAADIFVVHFDVGFEKFTRIVILFFTGEPSVEVEEDVGGRPSLPRRVARSGVWWHRFAIDVGGNCAPVAESGVVRGNVLLRTVVTHELALLGGAVVRAADEDLDKLVGTAHGGGPEVAEACFSEYSSGVGGFDASSDDAGGTSVDVFESFPVFGGEPWAPGFDAMHEGAENFSKVEAASGGRAQDWTEFANHVESAVGGSGDLQRVFFESEAAVEGDAEDTVRVLGDWDVQVTDFHCELRALCGGSLPVLQIVFGVQ